MFTLGDYDTAKSSDGKIIVGITSDGLEPRFGTRSISTALLGLSLVVYSWSACHYLAGARHVESDLANAGHDRDVPGNLARTPEVVKR